MNAYNYCKKRWEQAIICIHCESDGCKQEWKNCYENDGTPDNSAWTSVVTDGILQTSPSADGALVEKFNDQSDNEEAENSSDQEQVMNSLEDPVTCTACKYDSKKMKTMCFNGI